MRIGSQTGEKGGAQDRSSEIILAVEDYESLVETLEILSDPEAVAEIRKAESQMRTGHVHGEAEVRAALAARRA